MTTFAIKRDSTPVCTWDSESGRVLISPEYAMTDDSVIVDEADHFQLEFGPVEPGLEYRIAIGDDKLAGGSPLDDQAGYRIFGSTACWGSMPCFESARGTTPVRVESRPTDNPNGEWLVKMRVSLHVLPSKLGEERYLAMTSELTSLSRGLLVDLYGKSSHSYDLRLASKATQCRLPAEELAATERVLDLLPPILMAIARRPASSFRSSVRTEPYWGTERLSPASLSDLSRRGVSPRLGRRPIQVRRETRRETFDVPEHRVIRAALRQVASRAAYLHDIAQHQVLGIQRDRKYRDLFGGRGQTLYESFDLPRIRRLGLISYRALNAGVKAKLLTELPYLVGVPTRVPRLRGGLFERNDDYRRAFSLIRRYRLDSPIDIPGGAGANITKLTSRLFEQWCYVRLVEAFRAVGLDLREWTDVLRQHLRTRFTLDFERGLMFEGEFAGGLRLRIRYEPWIHNEAAARSRGDTLYRGVKAGSPWSPDIVVECLRQDGDDWRTEYAVVLDCKYARRITQTHIDRSGKYLEIRRTHDRRTVARQCWLIALGSPERVECSDSAVTFGAHGPDCHCDEVARFEMYVSPGESDAIQGGVDDNPFLRMATGTLAYLRRSFGVEPRAVR